MSIHLARFISFFVAANVTFIINKNWAFKEKKSYYHFYMLGQSKAFVLNVLVFEGVLVLIAKHPFSNHIAFIVAAPFVLVFNFIYSKYLSFR